MLHPSSPGLTSSLPGLHRALRLAVAVGTATAGVCLVAAIATLLTQGGAASARRAAAGPVVARQADDLTASRETPVAAHSGGPRHLVPGPVVAFYHGAALKRRAEFRVELPGTWGLAWAFSCRRGMSGSLVVTVSNGTRRDDPAVDASGPAGDGISWTVGDPGHESMSIVSRCPWAVRVVLPRPAS